MAEKSPANREYARLTEEFLEWNRRINQKIQKHRFITWATEERKDRLERLDAEHRWAQMMSGKPVLRELIDLFLEYLTVKRRLGDRLPKNVTLPCEPPDDGGKKVKDNVWRFCWIRLLAYVAENFPERFTPCEEAYCHSRDDLELAASMMYQCLGRYKNKNLSRDDAIAYSEKFLGLSLGEYADQLQLVHGINRNSVLFATRRMDGVLKRVGMCATYPVVESFRQAFAEGGTDGLHVSSDDLAPISDILFINAVADNMEFDGRWEKAERSMAMVGTVMYQLGALCPSLEEGMVNPRILCLAGTEENDRRIDSFCFKSTGARSPGTNLRIAEFAPPNRVDYNFAAFKIAQAQYATMRSVLLFFQAAAQDDESPSEPQSGQ